MIDEISYHYFPDLDGSGPRGLGSGNLDHVSSAGRLEDQVGGRGGWRTFFLLIFHSIPPFQ